MKPKKNKKQKRMRVLGKKYEPMPIEAFRKAWINKGYDLIDITRLCSFKLGCSGWCNDFNEPDEEIYHIQVIYRDENIGVFDDDITLDEKYVVFTDVDKDFIIFRKAKIEKD